MSVDTVLFTSIAAILSPIWLLNMAALFLLATAAGLPLARRIDAPGATVAISLVVALTVTVAVSGTPLPFTKWAIAGVLAAMALGLFLPVRAPDPPQRLPRPALMAIAALCLVFLWLLSRPEAYMHYDYFHANMRSLDLARSGSVLSDWYRSFDPGGWFLIDQTTAIVLDGLEIVWATTDTGILPRVYTGALALWLLALVGRRDNTPVTAATAAVLVLYVADNSFAFRPHIYVGLCLAVLSITLAEKRRGSIIATVILIAGLALAKRDGLVLAPLVGMVAAASLIPREWIKPRWLLIGAVVATIPAIIALSATRIGGVPVGLQLWMSAQGLDLPSLITRAPVQHLAAILIFCAAIVAGAGRERRHLLVLPLVLIVLTGTLVLASAVLLEGADRFNEGSMIRKLLYFMAPQVMALLALAALRITAVSDLRNASNLAYAVAMSALLLVVGYQLRDIVRPRTAWGIPAIAAVDFFRQAVPAPDARIGFYAPTQGDMARTPFGDVDAYQFPQMTAYLGRDFRFGENLQSLLDRDVLLVPPSIQGPDRLALIADSKRRYRELEGGYGLLVDANYADADSSLLILRKADGGPLSMPLQKRQWQDLEKAYSPGLSIVEVPWPAGQIQATFVWPEDSATWVEPMSVSIANPGKDYIHRVEFREHPLGDRLPLSISVTADGRTLTRPASEFLNNGRYVLPIESVGDFTISFTAESQSISRVWKVPYFVIFDLTLLLYEG